MRRLVALTVHSCSPRRKPRLGSSRIRRVVTERRTTYGIALVVALVAFFSSASDASAQRRRQRRAPPPAQEAPAEAAPEDPSGEAAPAAEGDAAESTDTAGVDAEPADSTPTEPPAPAETDPWAELPDLGPLRDEFAALMDDLVQTRSRIAVLGRQLFETKVRVTVENRADDQTLGRLALRLDGAPIHEADGGGDLAEGKQVFEGFAAPGPHVLAVELEQRARADDAYRYTQSDTFRVQVVRGQRTDITIVLDDDSDIADDFADDGEGEYDVRVRVRVAARELGDE